MISYEQGRNIKDVCRDVRELLSEQKPVKKEQQMSPESLTDALANMTAAAKSYADAMAGMTPENLSESVGEAAQALAEQLRAVVNMARHAPTE